MGRGHVPRDPPAHGVVKLPSTFLPVVSLLSCERRTEQARSCH